MTLPLIQVLAAACTLIQSTPAQETPVADPEKLFAELQQKLDALGSISAKLALDAIDTKGGTSPRHKASFHLRLAEGWLYVEGQDVAKKEAAYLLIEADRPTLAWEPGKSGQRIHLNATLREVWKHQWHFDRERQKVLDGSDPAKNLEDHIASLRPALTLQIEPAKAGAAASAQFRMVMGKSTKGGVSWLKLPRDFKIAATLDEVIVRETTPTRTTVIDRKTGMLRTIRLDFPSAESRLLAVTDVSLKQPKPEVRLPELWTDRPARIVEANAMVAAFLKGEATRILDDLLKDWPLVGAEDRGDSLRDFFAWIGAEQDALHRESARVNWAANLVKSAMDQGTSLDDIDRRLDEVTKHFEAQLRAAESDPKTEGSLVEALIRFREECEKSVAEAPGSDEARKLLVRRIREGFEPERLRKARPSRELPEPRRLLREAIDAAREKKTK